MTFKQMYDELPERHIVSPRRDFIRRVAKATRKTEGAVRGWCLGHFTPDMLTQEAIAKEFGLETPEGLFPAAS